MKITQLSACVTALLALVAAPSAAAQETITIDLAGAPLEIRDYSARYTSNGHSLRNGIEHRTIVENVTDKLVVAYSITFVAFDAFNRQMGAGFEGYSMTAVLSGRASNSAWQHTLPAAELFERYGTGVAWVTRARFSDGEIWEGDAFEADRHLREIAEDLEAARRQAMRDRLERESSDRPSAMTAHERELEDMRQRARAAQEEARRRTRERNEARQPTVEGQD
jgi:hypothetical protein